jgi:hypothetical protein
VLGKISSQSQWKAFYAIVHIATMALLRHLAFKGDLGPQRRGYGRRLRCKSNRRSAKPLTDRLSSIVGFGLAERFWTPMIEAETSGPKKSTCLDFIGKYDKVRIDADG